MSTVMLQGTTDAMGVEDVLDLLGATRTTGRLHVHGRHHDGRVEVSQGAVAAIELAGMPAVGELVERSATVLAVPPQERTRPVVADLLGRLVDEACSYSFESDAPGTPAVEGSLELDDLRAELAAQRVAAAEMAALHDRAIVSTAAHLPDHIVRVSVDRAAWWALGAASARPSIDELGVAGGLTRSEIRAVVAELLAAGIVAVEWPRLELVAPWQVGPSDPGGDAGAPATGTGDGDEPAPVAVPHPSHPGWAALEQAVLAPPPGLDADIEALRPLRLLDPRARDPWRQRRRQRREAVAP